MYDLARARVRGQVHRRGCGIDVEGLRLCDATKHVDVVYCDIGELEIVVGCHTGISWSVWTFFCRFLSMLRDCTL
jgi:hypothetical protein